MNKEMERIIALREEEASRSNGSLQRLKQVNALLFELLELTLEANAKLTKSIEETYPYIAGEEATKVLDVLRGLYEVEEREEVKMK